MSIRYDFHPVSKAHMPLLRSWLCEPHVARWWGQDGEDPLDEDLPAGADYRQWLVSWQGRPFAYVQDYLVHAWPDHPFAALAPGARGIDLFIGRADMVGRGHGSALIKQHVARLFREGAPQVGIDPHPDNLVAIAAYQKAGFRIKGPAQDSDWGRYVPMVCTKASDA